MRKFTIQITVLVAIGIGMIFFVVFTVPMKMENMDQEGSVPETAAQISFMDILDINRRGNISETGAWQNTKFTHSIDKKFGESLVFILQQHKISSITDLGCGTGAYVRMIEDQNITSQGFDGNPFTKKWDVSGGLCVGPVDITQKRFWNVTDAAMSIEVAEHIPAEYEEAFIKNLVNSARNLIFLSWGVPGQGGEGHVNCKWGPDVVKIMKEKGWEKNEILTRLLRIGSDFKWIRKNVQVFNKPQQDMAPPISLSYALLRCIFWLSLALSLAHSLFSLFKVFF